MDQILAELEQEIIEKKKNEIMPMKVRPIIPQVQ